ncbi:hypothetical protein EBQ26_05685 [Allofranklinella schreckenbergeri]|uniref:Uncharacterized protein n=1 Tax=Allofranklinella schreckenbergeri TaxID=1076744 RepID=A0A3M6Q2Y7_9BURK|nr:hypothetical protein [Allofranklinella schreckenbergeri]RMW96708.1 hypothetical protein EBQ25_10990 [Allofranklinella schreckenbergeri]RMW98812.1 hypothetical protein EBQ26_05685 [Allofranklinella schreckenbergeri]RMX11226.1 hypothetical protein EBQ24_02010 [Allofranklinella schreckenbergeri]
MWWDKLWLMFLIYPVVLLALPWFLVLTVRLPCKFRYQEAPSDALQKAVADEGFQQASQALQRLGYQRSMGGMMEIVKGVHLMGLVWEHPERTHRVALQFNTQTLQTLVEFQQRYSDGTWLNLHNGRDAPWPLSRRVRLYVLPGERNVARMESVFVQLQQRLPIQAEPQLARGEAGTRAMLDTLNAELYGWCKKGMFSMQCRDGWRRLGIGFAYWLVFTGNWPFNRLMQARQRKRTLAAIAE